MGWYKELFQDIEDLKREQSAQKVSGCLILMLVIIGIPLCIGYYVKERFFEYSEEEKFAYALGAYMADPSQVPMKGAISAFKKRTGGETPNMQKFGKGFYEGLNNGRMPVRTDILNDSHKYYNRQKKLKKKKIDEEHNGVISIEYGYCYGAVVNSNFNQKLSVFERGARDHFSFPEPRQELLEIKYPKDSVIAILARHKEFVDHITKNVQGQCKLF